MQANDRNYSVMLSGLILIGLLSSCSGGGAGTDPPSNSGNDDQLAGVTGTVLIEDAPLADLTDTSVIGDQDADKWALRVIDPTESLDDITIPHTDTTIIDTDLTAIRDTLLAIDLLPALDLTGGTEPVTPVEIDIILPLEESLTTTVDAYITFDAPLFLASARSTSQATGYTVRIAYTTRRGAATPQSTLIELDWNGQRLRRDTNGNGRLDDETYFVDLDRNGLSSNYQRGLDDRRGQGVSFNETGNVAAVDVDLGTIQLSQHTYLIDETTVITDSSNTTITLADIEAGQRLRITGRRGQSSKRYAYTVELLAD